MENEMEIRQQQNKPSVREIGVITAEIREICHQAQAMALFYAVEIGRRLEEAKQALPHGQWGEWLKTEVEFSQSTANNFMRLYQEYGSSQMSFFGPPSNSQTFANLPYSKALLLLAVPSDEREEFAAEVNAEDLSVKELKAAIEERDKAQKMAEAQKQMKEELAEKLSKAEEAANEALIKADEAEKLKNQLEGMKMLVENEKSKAAELREKLKKAEKDPQIPKSKLDQIRSEAEIAAKKVAEATMQKALDEAKAKAKEAEEEAIKARFAEKQARESLKEAQDKLKTASPEIAAFKALFDEIQSTAAKLRRMIDDIGASDPETAEKLSRALKAFGQSL